MAQAATAKASETRGAMVFAVIAVVLVVLAAAWMFVRNQDPSMLLLGVAAPLLILVAVWVGVDASQRGMPTIPWVVVALLMPILGLAFYLVARELRGRSMPG